MTGRMTGAMTLAEVARVVGATFGDALAVTGPGAISGAIDAARPADATVTNMELAYATATAFGIAITRPDRRVLAVEGDGSLLAGLGSIATVARYRPPNLVCIAVVNGVYGTGDFGVATQASFGADLGAVARALGWPAQLVTAASTVDDFERAMLAAAAAPGPWFISAAVDAASYGRPSERPRPRSDVAESGIYFRRHVLGLESRS